MSSQQIDELNEKLSQYEECRGFKMCLFPQDENHFTIKIFYMNRNGADTLYQLFSSGNVDQNRYELMMDRNKKVFHLKNPNENSILSSIIMYDQDSSLDQFEITWLNQKYLNMSYQIDSDIGGALLIRLFGNGQLNLSSLLMLLAILLLTSDLFTVEKIVQSYQTCTVKGNKQLTIAKILTAFLIVLCLVAFNILFSIALVSSIVPIRNLDIPYLYNCINNNTGLPFGIFTIQEILKAQILMLITASMATAVMSFGISCISRNRMISTVITMLIVILPLFVKGFLSAFSPYAMTSILDYLSFSISVFTNIRPVIQLFDHSFLYYQGVIVIWILLILCICVLCYCKQKKHIVK